MGDLTANFSLSEFAGVSGVPLTGDLVTQARALAQLLQPARDAIGPIRITSYVRSVSPTTGRTETGAHRYGWALDLVPVSVSVRALADWLASRYLVQHGGTGALAQVIDERTHVHIATRLVPGALAGYLHEPTEGVYRPTAPDPARITPRDYRVILGAALLVGVVALAY